MEFLEINYEPGPGSYNIKDNNVSKGFVIGTNVKDDDEKGGNDQRNMGPGKYIVRHSLQDKKIQGFSYDDNMKKC